MRGARSSDRETAMSAVSRAFLKDRLGERVTLEWAVSLNRSHTAEQIAIRELLERNEVTIAEPYLSAWRMVFHFWDRPDQTSSYDRLLLKRELKEMTSPREAASLIVDTVRPWLKVTVRGRLEALYGLPIPRRPKRVQDLVSVTFSSGDPLTPEELGLATIDDVDFLEELAKRLDAALFGALALAREIGAVTTKTDETLWQLHRSYFVPPSQWEEGGNEPDRFGRGFANCVKLLHAVIVRIGTVKQPAAIRLAAALPRDDWNVYRRLWAALARDASLVPSVEVEKFLIDLANEPFWMVGQFPEIAELRAVRWQSLSPAGRRTLEARLRRGTPASLRPKRLSAEEGKDYAKRRASAELQRVQVGGGQLSALAIGLISEIAPLSHAPTLSSVTDGFDGGVRVYTVEAGSGEKFQKLSNERLLQNVRESDASDDGNVLSYLGKNPSLVADLLHSLDPADDATPKLWRALGYYHRPPDLNATLENANAPTLEAIGPAKEILGLILKLDDRTIEKEIEALSSWMNAWDRLLKAEDQFLSAWFRLWPAAVHQVNSAVEREGALANRAHGSAVGNLVSAALSAMPQLSATDENPFDKSPLRDVLAQFADCDGEAKLEVQYRSIRSIRYFQMASPEWTRLNLVEPLRAASGATMQLWEAFGEAQLPQSEIMTALGSALAAAAIDQVNLSPEERRGLARQVIWSHVLPKLPQPQSAAVDLNATQQMLRMGDAAVRSGAVKALEEVLQHQDLGMDSDGKFALVKAIFEQIWPRERTLNSPAVSEALVELPAASGPHFAEATEMILPYLGPFDCWSLYDYGVWHTADRGHVIRGIENSDQAHALLSLMDKTVGDHEGAVIPNGLDQALEHIRSLVPTIEIDPRYQRLLTLTRR